MILLALALAFAPPSPATLDAPRKAFAACIKQFENKSLQAKMPPADYSTAVKDACPDEAKALETVLVNFDVAMGTKRATAQSNAVRDVDDYRATSKERYQDIMSPQ